MPFKAFKSYSAISYSCFIWKKIGMKIHRDVGICGILSVCFMDQITIKAPNPKCRLYWCLIESEAPFHLRFLFGVVKQFCWFGIWSNTQSITPVDSLHTTRSPPPPSRNIPYCIINTPVLNHTGWGEGWTSEKIRGALVHKRGQKYQHDWLYLQSINSITPQ